jgi:hypothetical protein
MKGASANATSSNGISSGSDGGMLTDLQSRQQGKSSPVTSPILSVTGVERDDCRDITGSPEAKTIPAHRRSAFYYLGGFI